MPEQPGFPFPPQPATTVADLEAENARLRILVNRNYHGPSQICSRHSKTTGYPVECRTCWPSYAALCGEHVKVNGQVVEERNSLRAQLAAVHDQLKALLDPAMPDDLFGAVVYMIDHSNTGWARTGELLAERRSTLTCAGYRADETRPLDSLVSEALAQKDNRIADLEAVNAKLVTALAEIDVYSPSPEECDPTIPDDPYIKIARWAKQRARAALADAALADAAKITE